MKELPSEPNDLNSVQFLPIQDGSIPVKPLKEMSSEVKADNSAIDGGNEPVNPQFWSSKVSKSFRFPIDRGREPVKSGLLFKCNSVRDSSRAMSGEIRPFRLFALN